MKLIWKFSIPQLIVLVFLGLVGLVVVNISFGNMRDQHTRALAEDRFQYIQKSIEARAQESVRQTSLFVCLPTVLQAYELALSGNIDDPYSPQSQAAREMLRKELAPLLENYKKETGKDLQLHFHLPNGFSLVRLWRAKNTRVNGEWVDISDDLRAYRTTVMDVNRDGKPALGLETGSGGLNIRGVIPVKTPDGRQIGSAEVLQDLETILQAAKIEGEKYIALYANRELANFAVELQDAEKYPPKGDFVRFTEINDDFIEDMITPQMLDSGKKGSIFTKQGDMTIAVFPIADYKNQQIGVLVCAVNAEGISMFMDTVKATMIFMLASMALVLFTTWVIGLRLLITDPLNTIKGIIQGIVENQVTLNEQLPSCRKDEIGDLCRGFNALTGKVGTMLEELREKEGSLTSLTVTLRKSEQMFKELAEHDPLTNLLNRRAFFSCAEVEVESASSLAQPCCLCMIDLDHFKSFNDTFGHLEGDRALQYVTQTFMRELRQIDIIGRYGGEEFIILLPSTEATQAYAILESIRQKLAETPFALENGDFTKLTASIGIAAIIPSDEINAAAKKLRKTIARADAALYDAKKNGRNMVCIAHPEHEA